MTVIFWKILIVSIILAETVIIAFLGWRVLELMKRVKQVQDDRNKLLESRADWEIEMRIIAANKIALSDIERKMILAALNMPEYKRELAYPKTNFTVRKVYRDLIEKIKESLK